MTRGNSVDIAKPLEIAAGHLCSAHFDNERRPLPYLTLDPNRAAKFFD
jgi:hypothetical protein